MSTGAGSTKKFCFGVRISLGTYAGSEDATIGLYKVSTDGFLRWIETSATTTLAYLPGFLAGIDPIEQSSDFRNGGNLAQVKGTSVRISNISTDETNTFWHKLTDAGISLVGLKAEIIEFDVSTSPATETVIYRGICEEAVSYTQSEYTIPVMNTYYKRRAQIGTIIDKNSTAFPDASDKANGKMVPVTFGEIDKAKFMTVADAQEALAVSDFCFTTYTGLLIAGTNTGIIENTTIFPVTSDQSAPVLEYKFKVSTLKYRTRTAATLVGKYVQVIEGAGQGEIRRIASARDSAINELFFTVASYFETTLQGNADATKTNQTWFKIVDTESEYRCDMWPCGNYLNSEGETIGVNGEQELYAYTQQKEVSIAAVDTPTQIIEKPIDFIRLPQYAYKCGDTGYPTTGNKNDLTIEAELFSGDFGKIDSFLIKPIKSPAFLNQNSGWSVSPLSIGDGFYKNGNGTISKLAYPAAADLTKIMSVDKDDSVVFSIKKTSSAATVGGVGIEFKLPDFPEHFDFNSAHIMLWMETTSDVGTFHAVNITIESRRFIGATSSLITQITSDANGHINDSPDFYYSTPPDNKNKYLWVSTNGFASSVQHYEGHKNFTISTIDKDKYNAIDKCLLFVNLGFLVLNKTYTVTIKKLAVMFKKSVNISDEIYTPKQGRLFNDTFGSRKTAANLIESPVDVLEHVCRLQNWSEVGSAVDFGHAYSSGVLINTDTTEGGFDFDGLRTCGTKSYKAYRQILDDRDAWSDEIIKSLCQQYLLCHFQDTQGRECVNYIRDISATPSVSLTLASIVEGSISEVTEQNVADVFCQPVVRYNKNYATGEYEGVIQITNSNAASYAAGYVTGYTGSEAQNMWNLANALWKNYGIINDPPEYLCQCEWIRIEADACKFLYDWFRWMGVFNNTSGGITFAPKKWISFSVPYETATTIGATHKPWFVSMHFLLNLPSETNGSAVQCIIEKISFDVDAGKANITAIMLPFENEADYKIIESHLTQAEAPTQAADIKESHLTKAEAPSQANDISERY